ncbi:MAG: polyribonucleotide nucleotidyltransferase [Candidatus Theseobacter exili]|nr:polyribonucleotide nucleotidyltransferase [Candidatus Theseobacter exili]
MVENISTELRKTLSIETGKMAKQANGSAVVRYGDTMVFAASVCSSSAREGIDFFPLTVDYREKTSAAGKFPGGFFKREGRPTEKEILTARVIDRPIRPLFPDNFFNEIQVMTSVLSADEDNNPDVLAVVAASTALVISDIPFAGPVGAVRVGLIGDEFIVNPTYKEMEESRLELVMAGTKNAVVMVEGQADIVSEQTVLEGLDFGYEQIKKIVKIQEELAKRVGKPKMQVFSAESDNSLLEKIRKFLSDKMELAVTVKEKKARSDAMSGLHEDLMSYLREEDAEVDEAKVKSFSHDEEKRTVRNLIIKRSQRVDGRGLKDIRAISGEVSLLPRTHGSALFTRGETQSLGTVTLGSVSDEQKIESYECEQKKSFMLHYNFPSFSVGEVRPIRGPGRREIGHGILAEKALKPILPDKENFPYTVRIVSDILESNGSSSMATVCSGCLSMMDAGVSIKDPVAGIAMGLIAEGKEIRILSDILGSEDHLGDMDFKVAGTREGITAFQMDVKVEGISREIMSDSLMQAREGRIHILDCMKEILAESRKELSSLAPRIISLSINPEKIGLLIGPGGKTIRKIIEETGCGIDVEDDGRVLVSSKDSEMAAKAVQTVKDITAEVEVGKIYKGKIKNVLDFGAFAEILPGKEGLIHISQLADFRVNRVEDVVHTGDEVWVKVTEFDEKGRMNLSMKEALKELGLEMPSPPDGVSGQAVTPSNDRPRSDRDNRRDNNSKRR